MFQRFEAALKEAIGEGRIAGGVALVAGRDGVAYEHAAGVRALGGEAAMDAATVFWIASMTKAVVSAAALQLVERGQLSLDGDLTGLVPDFRDLQVLTPQGLRPAKRAPSLRELLSHTCGFAYSFTSGDLAEWIQRTGFPQNRGTRADLRTPCCSIRARTGSTASASTGPAW